MGVVSTFGTYSLARLGIYSAQNSITITGNNISNVNTKGYTRQAPDQISLNSGGADRYQSMFSMRIGNGSLVKNVTQLRDQYLDLRYRDANADVGSVDATLAIQQQLAAILDEVGRGSDESGVLEAYFSAMEEQLQNMITQGTGDDRYETLFRSAANSMVTQLRSYAAQLKDLEEKTAENFQTDVDHVNEILNNIRELNVQIRKSQIFGSNPLELMDARNVLIDELSYYMDIRVSIEQEDIGNNEYVDRLVIRTVPPDGSTEDHELIYGVYGAQLSILNDGEYEGTYALSVSALKNINGVTYKDTKEPTTAALLSNSGALAKAVGEFLISKERGDYKLEYIEGDGVTTADQYVISWKGPDGARYSASYSPEDLVAKLGGLGPVSVTENGKTVETTYSFALNDDGTINVTTATTATSAEYIFTDTELHGALQSEREMLTESGGFWLTLDETDPAQAYLKADTVGDVKRGIPYYQKMLDMFASNFARMMNEANGDNGPLFSNSGDGDETDDITALNIAVSKSWANGSVYVRHGTPDDEGNILSTDNSNLLRMLGILQSEDHDFTVTTREPLLDKDGNPVFETDEEGNEILDEDGNPIPKYKEERLFKGSFQQLFTNHTVGNLATDIATNLTRLDNYETVLEEVWVERDGVSGVYLDDEAMNMMQYQQAYNAACRLMTTYDEMIDKLVNGM